MPARPILLALLLSVLPAAAKEEPRSLTPQERLRKRALAAGLSYLARNQMRDGAFGRTERGTIGITSLSLLAFMAQGHQENRGRYGEVLRKGVDFLLKRSARPGGKSRTHDSRGRPVGFIYHPLDGDSRMHGHGYATQVLVLAYGSGRSDTPRARELQRKIRLAVKVIENSQTVTGGWGYEPSDATFHEGSVTVTVVQALRLATNAGFVVGKDVHDRGLKYLKQSQKRNGSFRYSVVDERSSPALTAAAVTAMHGFGEYYSPAIRKGLEYLEENYRRSRDHAWPFYANYYAAQAFYRAGGRLWNLWNREMVPVMLDRQFEPGYWDDKDLYNSPRAHGRAYATALSCLALSVPDGQLPLFQK